MIRLGSTSAWNDADLDDDDDDEIAEEFEDSEKQKRDADSEKQQRRIDRERRRIDREWEEGLGLRPGELALKQAKMEHAIGLIEAGVDPQSDKVTKLLLAASAQTFVAPGYDMFAGRSEDEVRDWHLFTLYLVRMHGWRPEAASGHVEWVLQRPFQNVAEWLGEEGDKFRNRPLNGGSIGTMVKPDWFSFAAQHAAMPFDEIVAELDRCAKVA
jgi:hypothetical protein